MKKRIVTLLMALIFCSVLFQSVALADNSTGAVYEEKTITQNTRSSFPDVDQNAYYAQPVEELNKQGIITGYNNGSFGVGDEITRGQLATILFRIYGNGETFSNASFPDVANDVYYTNGVAWANSVGYMTGYDDGTFGPDNSLTREQLVTVLHRILERPDGSGDFETYKDGNSVSGFAVQAMKWAIENKVLTGTQEGYLLPTNPCYREQSATIIYRFISQYPVSFVVTFDSRGGSEVPAQTVRRGGKVTIPENPENEDLLFDDWYTDIALTTPYDFDKPVTSDLTLYAGWADPNDNLHDDVIDYGDITERLSRGQIDVIFEEDGDIRVIDGKFTEKAILDETDAAEVLNSASSLFDANTGSFAADASEVVSVSVEGDSEHDDKDEHFYRYSPVINGIPVLGSQIVISTNHSGKVTGLFSAYDNEIHTVDTNPYISADEAILYAVSAFMDSENTWNLITEYMENNPDSSEDLLRQRLYDNLLANSSASLIVYAADENKPPRLVYAVNLSDHSGSNSFDESYNTIDPSEITKTVELEDPGDELDIEDSPALRLSTNDTYYIYANDSDAGEVCSLVTNEELWTPCYVESSDLHGVKRKYIAQEENGVVRMVDPFRKIETYIATEYPIIEGLLSGYEIPGKIVKSVTKQDGTGRIISKSAVSAHYNMERVFDYYLKTFLRWSYDGHGAKIITTIGYNDGKNAFWTSSDKQFVFEKGNYEAALDVVGHEFTHAVIDYVIIDHGNQGLLYQNESGALNESYADILGTLIEGKTGEEKWLHGEDSEGGASRSLQNPSDYGKPEHYSAIDDEFWNEKLSHYVNYDNGGVHFFSSIYNFAAYKMMTDSRTDGISEATWAKVFYRSLFRMTTTATFLEARGAVIATAKERGFNEEQLQAIRDAFDAVGICEPDSIRIVLRWGESPNDLDAHLVGPGVNNDRFHVWYEARNYYTDELTASGDQLCAVDLDYDDTTSYGPEVTTIHLLTPGNYYFYVHDYTNGSSDTSTALALSGATVNVYRGTDIVPTSFIVDSSSQGTYWNVFKLTILNDKSFSIIPINTYASVATYN